MTLVLFFICATDPILLDRATIETLVRDQSPALRVVQAKEKEVLATKVGASAPAPSNPDISGYVGPRIYPNQSMSVDFFVGLSWPVDFSFASSSRSRLADERNRGAQAQTLVARRRVLAEALLLWIDVRELRARVILEAKRVKLDEDVIRIAEVKRKAGTVGDSDTALAKVLRAEGRARLAQTSAEADAKLEMLRGSLGLGSLAVVQLPALGEDPTPLPELTTLLQRLSTHPSLLGAAIDQKSATLEAQLQARMGAPVPRLLVNAERSPEYGFHGGIEVPLPIYQRNQTNTAVASARAETANEERALLVVKLETDLRAAFTRLAGAQAAHQELATVTSTIDDSEHLATRSYELGQGNLYTLITARREAALARGALLDARAALARAEVALQWAGDLL